MRDAFSLFSGGDCKRSFLLPLLPLSARLFHLCHRPFCLCRLFGPLKLRPHFRRDTGALRLCGYFNPLLSALSRLWLEISQVRKYMKSLSIELPEADAWKKKQLVFFNVLVVVLLWSLFSPAVKIFWETLDVAFFKAINSTLRDSPRWQLFWALANHKLADWVEDLLVLGFFIAYVARAKRGMRVRRAAE